MSNIDFKEELHPRAGKGSREGGRFVSKSFSNVKERASLQAARAFSMPRLTDSQKKAISDYVSGGGSEQSKAILDKLIGSSRVTENVKLYRGITPEFSKKLGAAEAGQVLTGKDFLSAALTRDAVNSIEGFNESQSGTMVVQVPKDSRAALVGDEVLLPRGSRLSYVGNEGGEHVFKLEPQANEFASKAFQLPKSDEAKIMHPPEVGPDEFDAGNDAEYLGWEPSPEPKKKIKGYKVFNIDEDGNLHPAKVKLETRSIPVGKWIKGSFAGKEVELAARPAWHMSDLPMARQMRSRNTLKLMPERVFAEVEMGADKEIFPGPKGLLGRTPEANEFYRHKQGQATWSLGGSIKVVRLLNNKEVASILTKAGYQKDAKAEQYGPDVVARLKKRASISMPEEFKPSTKLYRGDATQIGQFNTEATNLLNLFGQGIYLTDSKRVAGDYTSKGRGAAGDILFSTSGTKLTKQKVIDSYVDRLARKFDDGGVDHSSEFAYWSKDVPFSSGRDWSYVGFSKLDNAEREKRLGFARAKWKTIAKDYDVRVKLDGTAVIQRKSQQGNVSSFDVPKSVLDSTLDADAEIDDKVLDNLTNALVRSGDKSTARDIIAFVKQREDNDERPSFREIYTGITVDSPLTSDPDTQAQFRDALKELGYTGIRYAGGITMGGGYRHTAYVLWDDALLQKARAKG